MSQQYNTVTVQNSSTLVLAANNARRGVMLKNQGANNMYVGMDASVSSSNGFLLFPQDTWSLSGDRCYRGAIYGITASSTNDVRFWEWEA